MNINILDHPLIQKYFGCAHMRESSGRKCESNCQEIIALDVLRAMQQPIKMYEQALYTHNDGKTWQVGSVTGDPFKENEFHPTWLRLPDQFQNKECECVKCHEHHHCSCVCHINPDPVEEKIRVLAENSRKMGFLPGTICTGIESLRELGELARKQ